MVSTINADTSLSAACEYCMSIVDWWLVWLLVCTFTTTRVCSNLNLAILNVAKNTNWGENSCNSAEQPIISCEASVKETTVMESLEIDLKGTLIRLTPWFHWAQLCHNHNDRMTAISSSGHIAAGMWRSCARWNLGVLEGTRAPNECYCCTVSACVL